MVGVDIGSDGVHPAGLQPGDHSLGGLGGNTPALPGHADRPGDLGAAAPIAKHGLEHPRRLPVSATPHRPVALRRRVPVVGAVRLDAGKGGPKVIQRARLATGELRATMALTEPGGGSDLQAMRTTARADGDEWVVTGSKTWITNARRAGLIALLCKTDPQADPPHRGMSILLAEPGPGLTVERDLPKLGYKGVESCEVVLDGYRAPRDAVLGGEPGRGFGQMMRGLELGRIQVAARAVGVARAAFEDALRYAQERESFGVPIWRHQSVGNLLADMATRLTAARQLVLHAAARVDSGDRADLEAGMAKLFASEAAMQNALDAVRVHGGYGYSTEFDVERYFRDAPLMIVGEGTNEIQRNVIVAQLVERGGLPD